MLALELIQVFGLHFFQVRAVPLGINEGIGFRSLLEALYLFLYLKPISMRVERRTLKPNAYLSSIPVPEDESTRGGAKSQVPCVSVPV